ncbi:Mitochondrial presequence protease [Pyrenophora seminiperda CCB06]|uniref:Presequence protease, mitochondrial n=1 Tax=Pyrenophora seminiperda CCB06 TaxID=1302712 RepID=A0A3M7MHT1_9PLEO|nr:Mitochondrial presequence protease [Pyrenophora seminiperda CCB06]
MCPWQGRRHAAMAPRRLATTARRGLASLTHVDNFPNVGEQLHGFTLKRVKQVPELELTALHLQHDKTGADYLHIARDDANNVFSIGFKTNPPDATGVPHILEHTTLCGSERYPVRDPFFKMLPRSLSNFMNAWTFADHTGYPFATTNAQDFKNLMSVYLDATLHPLLKENDFTQEGWRLGPENPLAKESEDPNAKRIVFKGVVYNEMKGQMSDASYLFYTKFQDHLYPAINNSGGDPQKITDLTWKQLRKFHADHYHPSNAKILTYGDMPLVEHLKEVDSRLSSFSKISVDQEVKAPITLEAPKHVTVDGPLDPLVPQDRQYKTSVTWMMGDTADAVENFALGVLSSLLMSGYGSPLYRSLVESGLGADFSANTGYDSAGRRGVFSALAWQETVDAFQNKYAEGNYLESLIEKYLLNDNTLTFTMKPSETFSQELVEEESQRLAAKISETTKQFPSEQEARKYLEERELQLLEVQEKARNEDLSCLPTVHVKDIPREKERTPLRHTDLDGVKVQWREAPTNGLTYFRAVHKLHDLPDELREMIPLFTSAIMRLGTKDKTMEQLEEQIKLKTGGIAVGYHSSQSPLSLDAYEEGMSFSGYAFDRNIPDMYELIRTIIQETDFDGPEAGKQIRELLQSAASGAVNSIAESGHSYAMRFAEAGTSPVGRLAEETGGITQVKLMTTLASQESLDDVVEKLKAIQSFTIANGNQLRVALNCGTESSASNQEALGRFLSTLPKKVFVPTTSQQKQYPRNAKSFFHLPYQVYYSARAIPTIMAEAGQWARDRAWTAQDLEEAKLSAFQGYDAPQSVSREGMRQFLSGVTDDMLQTRRERLLDVTAEQVQAVADQFLVSRAQESSMAILGEKKDWVKESDGWQFRDLGMSEAAKAAEEAEGVAQKEDGVPAIAS